MGIGSNSFLQYGLHVLLLVTLLIAAFTDIRQRRIPNLLTLPTILLALLCYFITDGLSGLFFSLKGSALAFMIFLPPFLFGAMGAGDVKLMSAVGAVLGPEQTLTALLFIFTSGALLAVFQMIKRGTLQQTISRMGTSFTTLVLKKKISVLKVDKNKLPEDGIPFGVAITIGTFMFFFYLASGSSVSYCLQ